MRGNDFVTVHLDVLWAFSCLIFTNSYSTRNDFKSIYMLFYMLNLALYAIFGGLKWFVASQIAVSKCRLLSFFASTNKIFLKNGKVDAKNDRAYLKKGLWLGHKTFSVLNLNGCESSEPTYIFISHLYSFCQTEGKNHFQGNYNGNSLF